MIQTLGRRFVYYFNKTYKRSGTLWEGRYKACLVGDPRYVLTCYRYIELNPVRAHICSWPGAYRWSSFRENALGESPRFVTPHADFLSLGASDEVRRSRYLELFEHAMDAQSVEVAARSPALRPERVGSTCRRVAIGVPQPLNDSDP